MKYIAMAVALVTIGFILGSMIESSNTSFWKGEAHQYKSLTEKMIQINSQNEKTAKQSMKNFDMMHELFNECLEAK